MMKVSNIFFKQVLFLSIILFMNRIFAQHGYSQLEPNDASYEDHIICENCSTLSYYLISLFSLIGVIISYSLLKSESKYAKYIILSILLSGFTYIAFSKFSVFDILIGMWEIFLGLGGIILICLALFFLILLISRLIKRIISMIKSGAN